MIFLLYVTLGFLLYGRSLNAPFEFDDYRIIADNVYVKHLERVDLLWKNNDATRFLPNLTFAINYKLFGLNLFGFHLVNLLLHCFAAFLVYQLVKTIFESSRLQSEKISVHKNWISVFSGLLFCVHPIQTQAVTYIVQRSTCMATLFYLGAVILYAKYRLQDEKEKRFLWFSYAAAFLSVVTKQIVVSLPFVILLYEIYFLKTTRPEIKKRSAQLLPFFLVLVLVPLATLFTHARALDFGRLSTITDFGSKISQFQYLLTEANVVRTYLRLLFFPVKQNLDYDYPISTSITDPETLGSVGLIACIFLLTLVLFKKNRLLSYSMAWFLITLAPESSFISLPDVIFEHRLYLPSVGFVLFVTSFVFGWSRHKALAALSVTFLAGAFSVLTYQRNAVWSNPIVFMQDVVQKSPRKPRAIYNLAKAYQRKNSLRDAEFYYRQTLLYSPADADSYNSLGEIYRVKGDLPQAEMYFNKAVSLQPDHEMGLINLGVLLKQRNQPGQAIEYYRKATKANPNSAMAYNNIGNIYYQIRRYDIAEENYRLANELNPDLKDVYLNRGNNFFGQKNFSAAIRQYEKALAFGPDEEVYGNLADAYEKNGDARNAQAYSRLSAWSRNQKTPLQ